MTIHLSHLSTYQSRKARISMTPLIDVVFILLVFLLLASSFLEQNAIEFRTGAASTQAESPEVLRVIVGPDWIEVEGRRMGEADLPGALDLGDRKLAVVPASGTPVQRLVDVLDRLEAAGLDRPVIVRE